jgi:hypothetical protein
MTRIQAELLLGAMALAVTSAVHATSYVPVADEDLVDQAATVAVVRVVSAGSSPRDGRPATEYVAEVERTLKGRTAATITVRVPGGVAAGGKALKVWGAPRFAPGERAILFLSPNADGTHSVLHLMLGAFHAVPAGGRRLALRDLSEARRISSSKQPERPRDFGRFSRWIAARARGEKRQADYFVNGAGDKLGRTTAPFTLMRAPSDNLPVRWFDFDTGGHVSWYAHEVGQQGLAGGGYTELQTALQAWTADPDSVIDYRYEGTTDSAEGFTADDGLNTVLFNDPNDEVSPYVCGSGGILAMGGPWYLITTASHKGQTFHPTVEADVVINDGIECTLSSERAEAIFAHELGHTLGVGHSPDPQALMWPSIHANNPSAALHNDDRAAVRYLYSPPPSPASFYTIPPCRLVDTRMGMGGVILETQQTRFYQAAGPSCGIPTDVRALAANMTAVNPSGGGHFTAYPSGVPEDPIPSTSTVSFGAGQTRANNVVLPVYGTSGFFAVHPVIEGSNGQAHLVVDVTGYFK